MLGPVGVDCDSKVIPVQKAIDWALGEAILREIGQHDIAHASYLAMRRAIARLCALPELSLIDGSRFQSYKNIPYQCIVKSDSQLAPIVAASVLAKVHLGARMCQLAQGLPGHEWGSTAYLKKAYRCAIYQLGITDGPSPWLSTLYHHVNAQLLRCLDGISQCRRLLGLGCLL